MAGIYIHIPFCNKACYYCNFHFSVSQKNREALCSCLEKELLMRSNELLGQAVKTIYLGGGTPSVLSISEIESLLDTVFKNYNITADAEITLEANPDDLSLQKIKELASTNINRLSIGIQSFRDSDLKFMNRSHTGEEAESSLKNAMKYFDNITVDLIYGIPNMSDSDWSLNLKKVINLGIPHISAYALTVEEKTALHHFIKKGKIPPISEQKSQSHFNILMETTENFGYDQYEISNFGKPNHYSKHNTSYWKAEKYVGIGPSAHSFDGISRSWNIASNSKYMKAIAQNMLPKETELLSKDERFNEYIMTGLRVIWGVDISKVREDFGKDYAEHLSKGAAKHIENGFLCLTGNEGQYLKTTKKGRFLADGLASDLFIV